ncbi:MAG: tRNA pseudouridine(38-40) synthase TruA [Planctomycetes bacterium]|nr:tRNA pseudouridine(38-40) synthase TruA [Planctomycetota bacterium]
MPDPTERNLKTVIEYDGTAYVGWERQKNGLGIQEVLEEAVHTITRERVVIEGSGRTDAGVHALGQVASFRIEKDIHVGKLRLGLNAVLPPDIAVLSIEEVAADFHARRSAKSKRYRYTILNAPARRPHARHVSYHFPQALDHEAMGKAAHHLVGEHDFTAFAREADQKKTCVRTILEAQVVRDGSFLHVDVVGTGFLYNMVRIITGTLIEVGVGKRGAETVPALLRSKQREETGYTVPAHGLALVHVGY